MKWKVELKKFFAVPKNLVFMILAPLFFTWFFGTIYTSDYLNDIPIAILDGDESQLSRSIIDNFADDQRFDIRYMPLNMEEMKQLVDTKKVYMGVVIPEHLEADIKSQKDVTAALVVDGTNIAISNSALGTASDILNTMGIALTKVALEEKGTPAQLSESLSTIFSTDSRILWDPKLSYKYYIIPGLVLVLAQQLFLSVFVVNYIKDKQNLLHKMLIHIGVSVSTYYLCLLLMQYHLHMVINGNLGIAAALVGIYLFSLTGVAMAIGALTKTELKATQFCMMLSLPTFLMAGYIWPVYKMPIIITALVKCIWPLIYMLSPLRDYLIKGSLPFDFATSFGELMVFGLIWGGIGYYLSTVRPKHLLKED